VGTGIELKQIAVAGLVFGQENQVVVTLIARRATETASWRDIDFAADNWLDASSRAAR